jgi:hypothetical protein
MKANAVTSAHEVNTFVSGMRSIFIADIQNKIKIT